MAQSARYKNEEIKEKKLKKISFSIEEQTENLKNKYFDFLYKECGVNEKKINKDKVLNEMLEYALNKFDKSADWQNIVNPKKEKTDDKKEESQ